MSMLLSSATKLIEAMDKNLEKNLDEKLSKTVRGAGIGCAVASAATGAIPGVGGTIAAATYVGFVWGMYVELGKILDIPFSKNLIKSIASAVVTNVLAYAATNLVASTIVSLFPGIGTAAACVMDAVLGYAVVTSSGVVYMKILTKLAKKNKNLKNLSELSKDEIEKLVKDETESSDFKKIFKESKEDYKKAKEEFKGAETDFKPMTEENAN